MIRRPPPIWFFLLAVVLVYGGLSVLMVRLLRLPDTFSGPVLLLRGGGGSLILLGTGLLGLAIRHLSLRRASGCEIYAPPSESTLVTTGPYACVRNPLYVGVTIALLGWTLLLQSNILVIATLMMIGHFMLVARWEERELRSRFGDRYDDYRRATPAFLPRFRGRGPRH
jgi:protein-S-isoprenylcysteine O-methyltransferase Ste14